MKENSIRPATFADIENVFALIAEQNKLDYGSAMMTVEDLHKRWQNIKIQANTSVAIAGDKLAGYAELQDGDFLSIYLAERDNVNLGSKLLNILEEKAKQQNSQGVELGTRISEKNQAFLQIFLASGYKSDLSFLIMELNLDTPPATPIWPEGIQVRTFVIGQDEQATYQADEEVSQDKGYYHPLDFDGWSKRMGLNHERFDPDLWFLAHYKNDIVGVALNVYDKGSNTAWVDHLGVKRVWRNKGIGKALLLHTFGEFYRHDITHIMLSVDSKSLTNAPRLYESVGMKTIHKYHIYKKTIASK
ncbi:MAG: GNAT family N-acetyltransferase [Anaerolineales bacterium]|nr:GNAT family N-acetyltransferase [Anaerolineales bacterium]